MKQKTIIKSVGCIGVGVHGGDRVAMRLNPAPEDHGIVFVRADLPAKTRIRATYQNIKDSANATTIGVNGTRVGTVEHLMAALSALGIDNVEVEVHGPEVPILDGSAGPFVEMIHMAGIEELSAPKRWMVIKKPVKVRVNGSHCEIRPASVPAIECAIAYDHPFIKYQSRRLELEEENFVTEIADARTFGFLEDIERLRSLGLARGGSLENAIVIDHDGPINQGGFRWDDECVRHKILDVVGDMALAGMPVIGEIVSYKSGHFLNHTLISEIMRDKEAYEILEDVEFTEYTMREPISLRAQ